MRTSINKIWLVVLLSMPATLWATATFSPFVNHNAPWEEASASSRPSRGDRVDTSRPQLEQQTVSFRKVFFHSQSRNRVDIMADRKPQAYLLANSVITTFPSDTVVYTYDSLNRVTSVTYADGTSITYTYDAAGNRTAHQITGASSSVNTVAGNNVLVEGNGVIARFATITGGGATSIASINPASVGGLPNGFQLFADSSAFNISTTAITQGPIGVCFNGYFNMDPTTFSRLRLLHNENGVWVNRTASSDASTGLVCSNVSSVGQFAMVLLGPPTALVDQTSGRAAALNSTTFVRDPIPVIDPLNFSTDRRARLAFFVMSVDLLPSESPSLVTAQAEDLQHVVYPLTVESVAKVPNMDWLTEVIVKLPDSLIGKGEVQLSVTVRGIQSEKVTVRVQ